MMAIEIRVNSVLVSYVYVHNEGEATPGIYQYAWIHHESENPTTTSGSLNFKRSKGAVALSHAILGAAIEATKSA